MVEARGIRGYKAEGVTLLRTRVTFGCSWVRNLFALRFTLICATFWIWLMWGFGG